MLAVPGQRFQRDRRARSAGIAAALLRRARPELERVRSSAKVVRLGARPRLERGARRALPLVLRAARLGLGAAAAARFGRRLGTTLAATSSGSGASLFGARPPGETDSDPAGAVLVLEKPCPFRPRCPDHGHAGRARRDACACSAERLELRTRTCRYGSVSAEHPAPGVFEQLAEGAEPYADSTNDGCLRFTCL